MDNIEQEIRIEFERWYKSLYPRILSESEFQLAIDAWKASRQQLTKPADEVLIEALRKIQAFTGCSNAEQLEAMRNIYSVCKNTLNKYKPADDTISVSKVMIEQKPYAVAWSSKSGRQLHISFINDTSPELIADGIKQGKPATYLFTESQLKAEVERAVKECAELCKTNIGNIECFRSGGLVHEEITKLLDNQQKSA
jgi:hypothetical protein